jgi:hypothetical protein
MVSPALVAAKDHTMELCPNTAQTSITHAWEQFPCIKMNFKSAIEQHYACKISNIPTVGRSVMTHTKNVNFGGTAGKEMVIFFNQTLRRTYLELSKWIALLKIGPGVI